tara:strand:- start:38 stop:538 length:501 start_codon:yes stop_codon:yes gene_type:complete
MSDNRRYVSEVSKKAAIQEIINFINHSAKHCNALGYDFVTTNDAPEKFSKLKELTIDKVLPIADYGCDSSIYNCADTNVLFRFYHDVTHLEQDKGFSKAGEYSVIEQHMRELESFGVSSLAREIFYFDTIGQVDYYFHHKEFVNNQMAFLDTCLQLGLRYAVKAKH